MDKQGLKSWIRSHRQVITWTIAACLVVLFYHALTNFDRIEHWVSVVWDVLSPFIFGAVLAYLLRPIYNLISRLLKKVKFMRNLPNLVNIISLLFTYIIGGGILTLLMIAIVPPLIDSIVNLVQSLPSIGQNIVDTVERVASENEMLQSLVNELYNRADTILKTELMPNVTEIVDVLTEGTIGAFDIIKNMFIGIIVSVYLLGDKERLAKVSCKCIDACCTPSVSKAIKDELCFADKTFTRYILGTLLDAVLVGIITYIFGLITGLPSPILLAAIIAATNVIPIIGPFIGAIPTALLVLAYTPDKFLMYCIYLLILQQLDGHVFVPKVLGSAVGISGLTALFAIVVGGGLFGIPGMILGVPVLTVAIDIAKKIHAYRQAHAAKTDAPEASQCDKEEE